MSKRSVSFTLNGKPVTLEVEPRTTLLRALREHGVTSVKRGCEEGECGTCTVLLDDVLQKSCMGSHGLDPAILENHDLVGIQEGGKAMGNHDGRPSFGHFIEIIHDDFFRFIIKRTRCFIKNQDFWISKQCPCNGNPLFLST